MGELIYTNLGELDKFIWCVEVIDEHTEETHSETRDNPAEGQTYIKEIVINDQLHYKVNDCKEEDLEEYLSKEFPVELLSEWHKGDSASSILKDFLESIDYDNKSRSLFDTDSKFRESVYNCAFNIFSLCQQESAQ